MVVEEVVAVGVADGGGITSGSVLTNRLMMWRSLFCSESPNTSDLFGVSPVQVVDLSTFLKLLESHSLTWGEKE